MEKKPQRICSLRQIRRSHVCRIFRRENRAKTSGRIYSFSVFIKLRQAVELQAWRTDLEELSIFFHCHAERGGDLFWRLLVAARDGRGVMLELYFCQPAEKRGRPHSSKGREVNCSGLMTGCQGCVQSGCIKLKLLISFCVTDCFPRWRFHSKRILDFKQKWE